MTAPWRAVRTPGGDKVVDATGQAVCYVYGEDRSKGEMKHGPIALIDKTVLIVAIAPAAPLFEKTASNLREEAARGGQLIVFSDA